MVSSAVYRYFPSRDDLLTALDHRRVRRGRRDRRGRARRGPAPRRRGARWLHVERTRSARWALAHPHEYALIYGSPVPGYAAPQDTIDPRVARLVRAARHRRRRRRVGRDRRPATTPPMPRAVRADLAQLRALAAPGVPDAVLSRTLQVWAQLLRRHQPRDVRPPAQRDPRLRRVLRAADAPGRRVPRGGPGRLSRTLPASRALPPPGSGRQPPCAHPTVRVRMDAMGAVRMLAASDLRRRWRSTIAITLLVGVIGALILAAAARRAAKRHRARPLQRVQPHLGSRDLGRPRADGRAARARSGKSPGVEAFARLHAYSLGIDAYPDLAMATPVDNAMGDVVDRSRVIAGRQANPTRTRRGHARRSTRHQPAPDASGSPSRRGRSHPSRSSTASTASPSAVPGARASACRSSGSSGAPSTSACAPHRAASCC